MGVALRGHEGLYNIIMMEELHSGFAAGAGGITKHVPRNGSRIQRVAVPKYPYEYLAMDKDPEAMNSLYDKIRKFYQENF